MQNWSREALREGEAERKEREGGWKRWESHEGSERSGERESE